MVDNNEESITSGDLMHDDEEVTLDDLTKKKRKKAKVPKAPKVKKDLRTIFTEHITTLDLESIKQPWMAQKSFRLITQASELEAWANSVLSDVSRHHTFDDHTCPVIAVDTETDGLDTRVVNGEVNIQLAGICLSADGIEGLYIPANHEDGNNIPAEDLKRILQNLFDQSHLIFYNAKFDREVLRITLGLTFRDFPWFEDVQILNYLEDPKASVDTSGSGGLQIGGLKALTKSRLGFEQIELSQIAKVRASVWNEELQKNTQKTVLAPFTWVPTRIALWYAAGDAITTWLLWNMIKDKARAMKAVHRLDHLLVDTLTWIERQRGKVDVVRLGDTITFHKSILSKLTAELSALSGIEEFNPGSTPQLREVLFKKRGMHPIEFSEKTQEASTAIGVLTELKKQYPNDEFLDKLLAFREYAALHPENLKYDPRDQSARVYFKQNVVAGGRLAAAGGEFEKDGGCGLNPQAIKKVGGNWWVKGKPLTDQEAMESESQFDETALDPSCFKNGEKVPNIQGNHIGTYFGKSYCMVPQCQNHTNKSVKIDANEVINLRGLFIAEEGWTYFTTDFSNVEMRVAANVSEEPLFLDEFLNGEGDFHSLTARALFPEFSDPAVSKGRKKQLRSLSKIINFALLYGGTAYTIFENMVKEGHEITFEEAQVLVNKYWESVPIFAAWCEGKRNTARNKLMCRTPTGRVIGFHSAMKHYKIYVPKPEHKEYYYKYRELKRSVEVYKKQDMKEEALAAERAANALYNNAESGVKNYGEYTRFLGKAERVSINIPLQGTAGDLMRSALNKIRIWATSTPGVEEIFKLHCTVHDEIDFSVKNEFAPYIVPRLNRFMKLRQLHTAKGWKVPLETDCEYGQTWDIDYHLTGDKDHEAAGWYDVPGMQGYVPKDFSLQLVDKLVASLQAGRDEKVLGWLKENTHPRTHSILQTLQGAVSPDLQKRHIITMFQLDEFWRIDEDEVGEMEESVKEFAERNNFELPEHIELAIKQKVVEKPVVQLVPGGFITKLELEEEKAIQSEPEGKSAPVEPIAPSEEDEDMFYEPPKKTSLVPKIKPLTERELSVFIEKLGVGSATVVFDYQGTVMELQGVDKIPQEYIQ